MQIPNIFNQIDKIYIEKTGMPYSVSAAVGGSPTPQEQLDVSNVLFTWNGDAGYTATMDITVNGAPEGCYPMFAINTMDGEYQYNFELTDIQDGKLTLEIGWIGYDLLGDMVDVVIYKDSSQDPENIWKEVSVPFTAQLVPTFGPWTEDQENENYFYGSMSFENNILFEDGVLPEGWTAKVITDYGEVNLTVDDVTSANSIDIPIDTTDLTNLIHYTGEAQSLSTEFRLFNSDGHLMYYTEPVNVNLERFVVEAPTVNLTEDIDPDTGEAASTTATLSCDSGYSENALGWYRFSYESGDGDQRVQNESDNYPEWQQMPDSLVESGSIVSDFTGILPDDIIQYAYCLEGNIEFYVEDYGRESSITTRDIQSFGGCEGSPVKPNIFVVVNTDDGVIDSSGAYADDCSTPHYRWTINDSTTGDTISSDGYPNYIGLGCDTTNLELFSDSPVNADMLTNPANSGIIECYNTYKTQSTGNSYMKIPYPFAINLITIYGPTSAGPFSNVYDINITFDYKNLPQDWYAEISADGLIPADYHGESVGPLYFNENCYNQAGYYGCGNPADFTTQEKPKFGTLTVWEDNTKTNTIAEITFSLTYNEPY